MRLRKIINRPQKLQDEIDYDRAAKAITTPAFPDLQQRQIVPFNPHLPPAIFPSLPFTREARRDGDYEMAGEQDMDVDLTSTDVCEEDQDEVFAAGLQPKPRRVPTLKSPFDGSFEDDMATSDEEPGVGGLNNAAGHLPSAAWCHDNGHLHLQSCDPLDPQWNNLSPSVRLAIIARLSDEYPITRVYDTLGLSAQDVGDLQELAAKYNSQRELEDYLIYWMQQDQLRAILRTDHASSKREYLGADYEAQTHKYMTQIQAEIVEELLQATRADIDLGKLFLSQHGIQRHMVGCWDHLSGPTYSARPLSDRLSVPSTPVSPRMGLDSGYASAKITPHALPTRHEMNEPEASNHQTFAQINPPVIFTAGLRQLHPEEVRTEREVAIAKSEEVGRTSHPRTESCQTLANTSNDDSSKTGPRGRSRRNVRQTSRYHEAIAELKLKGSRGELDSDYDMSDVEIQDAEGCDQSMPSPRLRITSDKRIVGILSPFHPTKLPPGPPLRTRHKSPQPRAENSAIANAQTLTPPQPVPLLPLQRVVIRPPKAVPKPKEQILQHSLVPGQMSRFNQNLYGLGNQKNGFAKVLLEASGQEGLGATPRISQKPERPATPKSSTAVDQRGRSGTVTAPTFSPRTERLSGNATAGQLEEEGGPLSVSPRATQPRKVQGYMNDSTVRNPVPTKPDLVSSLAAPEPALAIRNGRTMVSGKGSPIRLQKDISQQSVPAVNDLVMRQANSLAKGQLNGEIALALTAIPSKPARPVPEPVYQTIDPVTGHIILKMPRANEGETAPPHTKKTSWAPMVHKLQFGNQSNESVTLAEAATQPADEVPLMPASKLLQPLANDTNAAPPSKKARSGNRSAESFSTTAKAPMEKRKYAKSEAQRQKEAARHQKMKQEMREREVKRAERVRESETERKAQAMRAGHDMETGTLLREDEAPKVY